MADQAPLTRTQNHQVPAVGTAGNDATTVLFQAPFACTVTLVNYVPAAAVTGAATNTRLVELVNKGQAGSATVQVAALQFNSGVNAAADDERAVTLSGTAANLVLAAGDTVIWNSTHVGTGITDPGGLVSVTLTRNDA
jgi:hypothetical protein